MKRLFRGSDTLVLDGAMGTQLIDRGMSHGQSSFLWSAESPLDVISVHRSYADAGADCLTTNTFSGSPLMLERSGIQDRFVVLNRLAVDFAKEASNGRCRILGDIGPCGDFLEPLGELAEARLKYSIQTQAEILADAGVDGFIVETMSDPSEMQVSIQALKEFGLPIIATFTYERNDNGLRTMMGCLPMEATKVAVEAGADAVGANCGTSLSLDDYLVLAKGFVEAADGIPVILQPNAGSPIQTENGFRYDVSPEMFASWAYDVRALGVRMIGGCCGTTPEHIGAAVGSLKYTKCRP